MPFAWVRSSIRVIALSAFLAGLATQLRAAPLWIDLGKDQWTQRYVNFNEILRVESALDAHGQPIMRLYLRGHTGNIETGDSTAIAHIKGQVQTENWMQVDPKNGYAYVRPSAVQIVRFGCDQMHTCTATVQTGTLQSQISDPADYKKLHDVVAASSSQWFASQITGSAETYQNLDFLNDSKFDAQSGQCTASLEFRNGNTLSFKDAQTLARLKSLFGATCPPQTLKK